MSYNPGFHFIAQIVPALVAGSFFKLHHVSFEYIPISFWEMLYFLVPQDSPGLSCISPACLPLTRKYRYSSGVLGACVLLAILVQKNKILERKNKIRYSSYFLVIGRTQLLFPNSVARNEVLPEFCSQHPLHNLQFSPPSCQNQERSGEKKKNKTHDFHPPTQFYEDHYLSFDFSPQSAYSYSLCRVLRLFVCVFCP